MFFVSSCLKPSTNISERKEDTSTCVVMSPWPETYWKQSSRSLNCMATCLWRTPAFTSANWGLDATSYKRFFVIGARVCAPSTCYVMPEHRVFVCIAVLATFPNCLPFYLPCVEGWESIPRGHFRCHSAHIRGHQPPEIGIYCLHRRKQEGYRRVSSPFSSQHVLHSPRVATTSPCS